LIAVGFTEEESIIGILKDENGPLKIDGARLIINELSFASSRPIGFWADFKGSVPR
jgi:hypothetical protein